MTACRNIEDYDEAWQVLLALFESVCRRLRENGFFCRTVQIGIRDTNLLWFERQIKLVTPACMVEAIADAAIKLLKENYRFSAPLRSLGVRTCNLIDSPVGYQLSLWGNAARLEKLERLETAVDDLRRRFRPGHRCPGIVGWRRHHRRKRPADARRSSRWILWKVVILVRKVYVNVFAAFTVDGQIFPHFFIWEDGKKYKIDRIVDIRRAASTRVGGVGWRYSVQIRGRQRYMWLEDNTWTRFMEAPGTARKGPDYGA